VEAKGTIPGVVYPMCGGKGNHTGGGLSYVWRQREPYRGWSILCVEAKGAIPG